jgi:hypothetical protein
MQWRAETMRTIILTYPGFQSLPRGVKQLLLATENFYFEEPRPAATRMDAARSKRTEAAPLATAAGWERRLTAFASVFETAPQE